MSKQTAIEWLEYQFLSPATLYGHDFIMDKLKQAKEMEKEQIKDAFGEKRQFMGFGDDDEFWITDMTAEQYYNETYNKES